MSDEAHTLAPVDPVTTRSAVREVAACAREFWLQESSARREADKHIADRDTFNLWNRAADDLRFRAENAERAASVLSAIEPFEAEVRELIRTLRAKAAARAERRPTPAKGRAA